MLILYIVASQKHSRRCEISVRFAVNSLILTAVSTHSFAAEKLSDAQVKRAVIQESLASYPGNCPCPYNTDRRGRAYGGRSAYSKPGGYAPICYE